MMATREPLVPQGREQGARQETEQRMERANMPKAPTQAGQMIDQFARIGAAPEAAIRPARADFDPLREAGPEAFPFLEDRTAGPTSQATAPQTMVDVFANIATRSNNSLSRAIAARLAEKAGGR